MKFIFKTILLLLFVTGNLEIKEKAQEHLKSFALSIGKTFNLLVVNLNSKEPSKDESYNK